MVLEYINALKWPVIVSCAAFLFRAKVGDFLDRLQSARVNAGGVSAELEARAAEAAVEAASEPTGIQSAPTPPSESAEPGIVRDARDDPAVSAAVPLSVIEYEQVQSGLSALEDFSVGGASVLRQISESPSMAVRTIYRHFMRALEKSYPGYLRPNTVDFLWPGTPDNLMDAYETLVEIREQAVLYGDEAITVATAHAYNQAARDWARQYSRFVRGALQAAMNGVPSARVEEE